MIFTGRIISMNWFCVHYVFQINRRKRPSEARRSAGSRQKGVCFYFFCAEKNQHAPALHLLNMRHAATQTRAGVCRIHFHLRHLIVSRRSRCSGHRSVRRTCDAAGDTAAADRLGESIGLALVFLDSFPSRLSSPLHTVRAGRLYKVQELAVSVTRSRVSAVSSSAAPNSDMRNARGLTAQLYIHYLSVVTSVRCRYANVYVNASPVDRLLVSATVSSDDKVLNYVSREFAVNRKFWIDRENDVYRKVCFL